MDFQYSEKTQDLINQVRDFIDNEVVPAEHTYHEQLEKNPGKPRRCSTNSRKKPAPRACGICSCPRNTASGAWA